MKKYIFSILISCGLLILGMTGVALANSAVDGDIPAMQVSPSTIILAKVDSVTVHTNIPATTVAVESVTLDGAVPTGVGVDNLGHLVARFAIADLHLHPGTITLTLDGTFTDGSVFCAMDTVTVK